MLSTPSTRMSTPRNLQQARRWDASKHSVAPGIGDRTQVEGKPRISLTARPRDSHVVHPQLYFVTAFRRRDMERNTPHSGNRPQLTTHQHKSVGPPSAPPSKSTTCFVCACHTRTRTSELVRGASQWNITQRLMPLVFHVA